MAVLLWPVPFPSAPTSSSPFSSTWSSHPHLTTFSSEPVIEMEVPSVERLVIRVPVGSVPELTPLPALDAPSLPLPFLASIEAAVAPLGTGLFTQAVVAFVALWRALGGSAGVRCVVRTEVPMAVGMGSSAAFNVAVSAALLRLLGHPITLDAQGVPDHASATRINGWAWAAERIMHGTPSGIDNATSSFGGVLAFTKGHLEALHNIPPLRFLLVNTRVYRNTKALVGKVGALVAAYPAVCVPLLDAVQAISQQALTLFRTQPPLPLPQVATPVAQLMAINDGILAALGVGHPRLDEVPPLLPWPPSAPHSLGARGGKQFSVRLQADGGGGRRVRPCPAPPRHCGGGGEGAGGGPPPR